MDASTAPQGRRDARPRERLGATDRTRDREQVRGADQGPRVRVREVKKEVDDALVARFGPDWIDESTLDTQVGAQVTVRYKGEPFRSPASSTR
jgi:hypothetical protein